MILKKIFFTKIDYWPNLNNKHFDFCDDDEPAKFVILIGKNGCGKTMLLNFLLQALTLYNRDVYTKSITKNFEIDDAKKCDNNIQIFFKDDGYDGKLNLTKNNKYGIRYDFSIDKNLYVSSFYCSYFYDKISSHNLGKVSNIISIYMDEHIDFQKISENLRIPAGWRFKLGEINLNNTRFQLYSLTNSDQINIVLNDKNFEDTKKVRTALEVLKKSHIINKINTSLKNYNFVYDQNKKCIYGNGSHYLIESLSEGLKHNLTLQVFFITIINNLKSYDKKNHFSFLFDEIEKSLCPKEQQKICEEIISYANKMKGLEYQFFIATHSPFIIKSFLNHDNTVIIDVENGKNIKKSKKLLLNKDNKSRISYDEIVYLYYDIITSSYYISLYEELKNKVGCESYKEMDDWLKENKDKINEIIKEKKLDKNNFVEIEKIKCIKYGKLNNDGDIKKEKDPIGKDVDLWTISTNLTRLRHMFAHAWKKEKNFLFYKKHPEQFKNNNDDEIAKTNEFYSFFKDESITNEEIESLLKKYIELMRTILINWEK